MIEIVIWFGIINHELYIDGISDIANKEIGEIDIDIGNDNVHCLQKSLPVLDDLKGLRGWGDI